MGDSCRYSHSLMDTEVGSQESPQSDDNTTASWGRCAFYSAAAWSEWRITTVDGHFSFFLQLGGKKKLNFNVFFSLENRVYFRSVTQYNALSVRHRAASRGAPIDCDQLSQLAYFLYWTVARKVRISMGFSVMFVGSRKKEWSPLGKSETTKKKQTDG